MRDMEMSIQSKGDGKSGGIEEEAVRKRERGEGEERSKGKVKEEGKAGEREERGCCHLILL